MQGLQVLTGARHPSPLPPNLAACASGAACNAPATQSRSAEHPAMLPGSDVQPLENAAHSPSDCAWCRYPRRGVEGCTFWFYAFCQCISSMCRREPGGRDCKDCKGPTGARHPSRRPPNLAACASGAACNAPATQSSSAEHPVMLSASAAQSTQSEQHC